MDYDRGLVPSRAALLWQQEPVEGKLTELLAVTLIVEIIDQRLTCANVTVIGRTLRK